MEQEEIELQPLARAESPPSEDFEPAIIRCIICLRDNKPSHLQDTHILVCNTHNIWVHMGCIRSLVGHNWYVDCPNTFDECCQFKPELVVGSDRHLLDYSVFAVKRGFYHGWIWLVVVSIMLNVFATYSISKCDLTVYQGSCYIAGVLSHGLGNFLLPCLFFYYHPTVTTYFKFEHNYHSVKQKLISEGFVLSLAAVAGIPLLVMIDQVLSSHLLLGVWITIFSGFITPASCIAIMHNLYEIYLQISSAEIVFTPTIVRDLGPRHQAENRGSDDL